MKVYVDTWIYVTEKFGNMGFIEVYRGILRYETGIYPTIPNFITYKSPLFPILSPLYPSAAVFSIGIRRDRKKKPGHLHTLAVPAARYVRTQRFHIRIFSAHHMGSCHGLDSQKAPNPPPGGVDYTVAVFQMELVGIGNQSITEAPGFQRHKIVAALTLSNMRMGSLLKI